MSGANVKITNKTYNNIDSVNISLAEGTGYARYVFEKMIGTPITYVTSVNAETMGKLLHTGVTTARPSAGYELFYKFEILDASTTQIVCGSQGRSGTSNDQLVIVSGKLRVDTVSTSTYVNVANGDVIEYHEKDGAINIGNSLWNNVPSGFRGLATATDFCIFGKQGDITSKIKVHEFVYSEGGTELVHLYPALDSEDVPCMYDTVSNQFIYATGTLTYDE